MRDPEGSEDGANNALTVMKHVTRQNAEAVKNEEDRLGGSGKTKGRKEARRIVGGKVRQSNRHILDRFE